MHRQRFLPGLPDGSTKIGDTLSILQKDGLVTYFVGGDNYYSHSKGDAQSQRFALATLMENGHVRARDLEGPPLNLPHRTLMNYVSQLRKKGSSSFFRSGHHQRARVITAEKVIECGRLLAEGMSPSSVAKCSGINDPKNGS